MSRIEKAMERAVQLRQGADAPVAVEPQVQGAEQRFHKPPPTRPVGGITVPNTPYFNSISDPYSPIGEEFRKLKAALVSLTTGEQFNNSILITSSVQNEGKSLIALNLAMCLAQEYDHTVLLLDADFRRPSMHISLGIQNGKGFADCLLGEAKIADVIIPTGIGRLSVITAGRAVPNSAELFASQKTEALIAEIKNRYHDRYIIFDSPPVLLFAESRTLGRLVDGVLFVIKEQCASQRNVREAIDVLKGCKLLGLVYNNTVIDRHDQKYLSYLRYYRT